MSKVAIEIKNLWKQFEYSAGKADTLKESVLRLLRIKKSTAHNIKRELYHGLDLTIREGEVVAILGRNGSGKSTLLKLISGIYLQDRGEINIHGTLSTLIELGAGFHPEFSGRDNIFVYGQILGIPKKALKERMNEIIEFSELGDYIDQPVRYYSSGMYMRLAFSVAVAVDPDILIIDEILSVGDIGFARKCRQRMDLLKASGKTICLVSHDLETIRSWANRVVILDAGRVVFDGAPDKGVAFYIDNNNWGESTGAVVASENRHFLTFDNLQIWQNKYLIDLMKSFFLAMDASDTSGKSLVIASYSARDLLEGGYRYFKLAQILSSIKDESEPFRFIDIWLTNEEHHSDEIKPLVSAILAKFSLRQVEVNVYFVPALENRLVPFRRRSMIYALDWSALAHTQASLVHLTRVHPEYKPKVCFVESSVESKELFPYELFYFAEATKRIVNFSKVKTENTYRPVARELASVESSVTTKILVLSDFRLPCTLFNVCLRSLQQFIAHISNDERQLLEVYAFGDEIDLAAISESILVRHIPRDAAIEIDPNRCFVLSATVHSFFDGLASLLKERHVSHFFANHDTPMNEQNIADILLSWWKERKPKSVKPLIVKLDEMEPFADDAPYVAALLNARREVQFQ